MGSSTLGQVCYITCGEDFSVFLTLDGGVFTCGAGENGRTGHGSTRDEIVPRKIMELMGSTVTQVACGRRHLLCRVNERILACGYGARGQLGCPQTPYALVPTPVPFVPNEESPYSPSLLKGPVRIFAGWDHSFLAVATDISVSKDFRQFDFAKQILTLNVPTLSICETFKDSDTVNQGLGCMAGGGGCVYLCASYLYR
ncbi:Probable E3 ubiquitin-protein ligase HERC3 [Eumeta japonica]|uniref:Probable E3 ubiquitin-protein ligase HERC3 n=1 Tax=Eumeta variegata TaxID=151549 RepID=A0A4C1YML9_EUMVA|nr:Probable E3 ubiquitin-protein ligase HERC3 [Eumeta japonica]